MTFTELLDDAGVRYLTGGHRHCRMGWVQFDCPMCGKGSEKYHMGYKISGGYVSCWRGCSVSLDNVIAELTGKSSKESRDLASALKKEHDIFSAGRERTAILRALKLPGPMFRSRVAHEEYLRERGFKLSPLKYDYGIRFLGLHSAVRHAKGLLRLPSRIYIPIYLDTDVVSWTTRTIDKHVELRYVTAPPDCEAHFHKELLYAENMCRLKHAVCACEGPFDAIAGGPGWVGTFGTQYTRAQALHLSKYPVRGVCYDAEATAQQRARELVDELSAFPGKTYNFILDHKDPAEDMRKNRSRDIKRINRILGI